MGRILVTGGAGGLGREVHVGRHTRQAIERLLDPRRARGAGHAGQAELDPLRREGRRRVHAPNIYPEAVYLKIP